VTNGVLRLMRLDSKWERGEGLYLFTPIAGAACYL